MKTEDFEGLLESIREARTMNDLLLSLAGLCETHCLTAARLEVPHRNSARLGHNGHRPHANGSAAGLHWMWPRLEAFGNGNGSNGSNGSHRDNGSEDKLANCWSLRLPLIKPDGRSIGTFTLYQSLTNGQATNGQVNDTMPTDLAQTTELLSRELSAALHSLRQASVPDEHTPATKGYLQDLNRERQYGEHEQPVTFAGDH